MNQTLSGVVALSGLVLVSLGAIVKQAQDNNTAYEKLKSAKVAKIDAVQPKVNNTTSLLVVSKTEIKYTRHDIDCLARNIYFEARGETTVGQYAIAQVTINRVKANRKSWGKSVCSVVYAHKQFSWTTKLSRKTVELEGKAWDIAKNIAVSTLKNGVRVKDLDKALFYHADFVNPDWRDDSHRIKAIGAHIFYTKAKGDSIKL